MIFSGFVNASNQTESFNLNGNFIDRQEHSPDFNWDYTELCVLLLCPVCGKKLNDEQKLPPAN